ncbi:MAG: polysaccharide deacetylase family protein [Verrucomicrobia bacterium]|nr:polysaccharide deacetylase family protein [Verrucomicrobiota bacterium]
MPRPIRLPGALLALSLVRFALLSAAALEPIPDELVVLTFDDSVASHFSVVRPTLKRHGFGATFFITEGFTFRTNKQDYMTWAQIRALSDDGFEIGNHTRDHMSVSRQSLGSLREQVEAISERCVENGIPRPTSFAYPGNAITPEAIPILKELGFRFARRGGAPEHSYEWGRGFAYEPGLDDPLLIPSAGDARPDWTLDDFKRAVSQASGGRIAVLQFHGAPDNEHPWVNTRRERFEEYMAFLSLNGFKAIALRDLALYVDPAKRPADPLAIVEKRKSTLPEVTVEGEVVDAANGSPLPSRIYIQGGDGSWHFPKSASLTGSAIRYERRNGSNTNSVEMHTTLSAHPFRVELAPGRHTFMVERGKEWFPLRREVVVAPGMGKLRLELRRWMNMAEKGWHSGDAHNHRDPSDLANVMLAEDVSVALPMVDWTTTSTVAPTASGLGFKSQPGSGWVSIDAAHAWQARNTEYEIFRTGAASHTLGALLILNHKTRFDIPALPLAAVAAKARAEGALLDLEKHNWPWSMALVAILNVDLYELANNHHWEAPYAIRGWAVPAPAYMGIQGSGTDTERGWTLYGFQAYYALLNSGFWPRPSAGTANGVHPVPLGFSRVYVHLDGPFDPDAWMQGLGAGRSFVTTGPMLFGQIDGKGPGEAAGRTDSGKPHSAECVVRSEQPLESVELVVNGKVARRFDPRNEKTLEGAYESRCSTEFAVEGTSWAAWRCFESRAEGRFRFAHTAPWKIEIPGRPMAPRREEAEWLVSRVKEEIARSGAVAPEGLIEDYRAALRVYEEILQRAR